MHLFGRGCPAWKASSFKYVSPTVLKFVIPAPACARVTDPESSSAPLDSRFHGNDEVKNSFTVVLKLSPLGRAKKRGWIVVDKVIGPPQRDPQTKLFVLLRLGNQ